VFGNPSGEHGGDNVMRSIADECGIPPDEFTAVLEVGR
jgi:hypothetical protein